MCSRPKLLDDLPPRPGRRLEDETPLEVLRRGDIEAAVAAAKQFASGEQGGH
jgi:hypothetical protein